MFNLQSSIVTVLLLLIMSLTAAAQQPDWEQVWQEVTSMEDADDEEIIEENYEYLAQLADNPIDLNRATREQLEQLPFLTAQQVMDIMEYLDRYGPMRSMAELKMIPSMDYRQQVLMPFFTYLGEQQPEPPHPFSLDDMANYGRHTLTATARMPFYNRKGDGQDYLGYKYRHSLRYEFNYCNQVRIALTGSQDAGEPFFSGRNSWGYDAYAYYVQVKNMGWLQNAVIGKYKVAAGMGLVLNTSFRLGKLATLQNMGRQNNSLRGHASRSEADYFQGVAATVRLSKVFSATAFVSYRPIDATLNASDGSAATLITSGYHRTSAEMQKKNNTHLTAAGAQLVYRQGAFGMGANMVYTHLDRPLNPNREPLYRRYAAHGTHFTNASIDYSFTHHRLSLSGETAINQDGAAATVNSLSLKVTDRLSMIALQRFCSYRYTGLYSHCFGVNSKAQNESGVFLGANWNPLPHLHLLAYADYAYFPWARYLVSQTSHATDLLLQATWQKRRVSIQTRGRMHLKQRDDETKTALDDNNEYRMRIIMTYSHPSGWSLKTQGDAVRAVYLKSENGYMLTEGLTVRQQRWLMSLSASVFKTDSYACRTYVYERQLAHDFSFPSFYGEGLHAALLAQADLSGRLRLAARLSYTNYFDRPAIGSGLQQIDQSHLTDLDIQLRLKL